MVQSKSVNTCKLVNLWLGEKLGARIAPQKTTYHRAKLEGHHHHVMVSTSETYYLFLRGITEGD